MDTSVVLFLAAVGLLLVGFVAGLYVGICAVRIEHSCQMLEPPWP